MVQDFESSLQAVLEQGEVPLGELPVVQEVRSRTLAGTTPKEADRPKRRSMREARRKGIDLGG
jgi:hypothetical protein